MATEGNLRFAAQSLLDAEGILRGAADTYPFLDGPGRALRRTAKVANRPLRIAILGKAASGKSSLANLLAGVPVLPVPSMAHARVPVLLTYAPVPTAAAVYKNGDRVAFPLLQDIAHTIAALQNSAAISDLLAGKSVRSGGLKFLEAGLPSDTLRSFEILELPDGHPGMLGYGIDAAIWTAVATQAWSGSERAQWVELPQSVRSRSLLAVTFCDLVAGRENELKQLHAKLETSAKPYFQAICFVANDDPDLASAASRNRNLFVQIQHLALQFAAERFGKAMAVAHRVMAKAAAKPNLGTESKLNFVGSHAVAEASKNLFDGGCQAGPRPPAPRCVRVNPLVLVDAHEFGTVGKNAARRAEQTSGSPAKGERSKKRSYWMTIGAAAAVAGAVTLAGIQPGLISVGRNPVSEPLPSTSKAVEQAPVEIAETRGKTEAEVAAAEEGKRAQADPVAAEVQEKALTEAAAAEVRRKAQAEAAAEPKRRKKADAGRPRRAEPERAKRHGRLGRSVFALVRSHHARRKPIKQRAES